MLTPEHLKGIIKRKIRCVDVLLENGEWHTACYMMGYVLECSLKRLICKRLNIKSYPTNTHSFLKTHSWDRLVLLAGLSEKFNASGIGRQSFKNWSSFTTALQGDWTDIRYHPPQDEFDQKKSEKLYTNLTKSNYGILDTLKKYGK